MISNNVVAPDVADGREHAILESSNLLDDAARYRVKKIRVYVPAKPSGIWRAMAYVYWCTLVTHLWRSGLLGYLVLCTPLARLAPAVAATVLVLSSLRTIGQTWAGLKQEARLISMVQGYGKWFDWLYDWLLLGLWLVVGVECALQIGQYLHLSERLSLQLGERLAEWPLLLTATVGGTVQPQGAVGGTVQPQAATAPAAATPATEEFRETLRYGAVVKIEESATRYRVTIGEMAWTTLKTNEFNRLVLAVLIYSAAPAPGSHFVVNARELVQALGWETPRQLHHWYERYRKTGNWSSVFGLGISTYLGKVRTLALREYGQDLGLTVPEVAQKLAAKGHHFSEAKIAQALTLVDFNTLRARLHARYQRRTLPDRSQGLGEAVQIELGDEQHRVRVGDLYWQIAASDRLGWIAALRLLTKARNINGDLVAPAGEIYQLAGFHSRQRLSQVLDQYDAWADHYREFCEIGPKLWKRQRLQEKILALWLPEMTLSCREIAQRLVESGAVPKISVATVRNYVRHVDFMVVRKAFRRYYQQGKYRKSSKYLLARYQELIGDLIAALQREGNWPKARIEKFIAAVPLPSYQSNFGPPTLASPPYSTAAWLKCFLFNLPKTLDGKTCCPTCGSFDTAPKSKIPQPQVATDPKTGQTQVVQTYRFYCKNPDCGLQSFSATADGAHILQEARFAQACLMLRLVMTLRGSYHGVAQLLGVAKSTVYDQLTLMALMATHWREILGQVRFSGTLCIDEKFVKISALKKAKGSRPFGYLFLAIDPLTYDLLHIEVYPTRDTESVVAFLTALKAQGIYPQTIMTDLFSGYTAAIRQVYGRSVTIAKCHFHFLKNIYAHIADQFGKKEVPEIAKTLRQEIFNVVDANAKKTIRQRHLALLQKKDQYLAQEPKLLPLFDCLDSYIPHLLRAVENERVSVFTNNACELVIRHFNQRYQLLNGFDTLDTARRHARLFQIVHRFTPLTDDVEDPNKRGRAPLQLAGYDIENMPLFQYLHLPLLFDAKPAQTLAKWRAAAAA